MRAARRCPLDVAPRRARRADRHRRHADDDGKLHAGAYAALDGCSRRQDRRPVTGRPAGWCDHIARMWPVDAVVGENGAFYMRHDAAARKLVRRCSRDTGAARAANRARIAAVGAMIVETVRAIC